MTFDTLRPIGLSRCVFLAALCLGSNCALALPPVLASGQVTLTCGSGPGARSDTAYWQIRGPNSPGAPLPQVLAFGGTPGIGYFSGNPAHAPLIDGLGAGHRIFELRYRDLEPELQCGVGAGREADGFYALCCGQGTPATLALANWIYDFAMQTFEARGLPGNGRILGVGHSLGSLTTEYMAFGNGRPFTKIANTGILSGNVYEGCRRRGVPGIDYIIKPTPPTPIMNFDFTSRSMRACTDVGDVTTGYSSPEIPYNLGFALYPHANNPVVLGLFEGRDTRVNGHVPQANLIKQFRDSVVQPASTETHYYGNGTDRCGHDVYAFCQPANGLYSGGDARYDALNFLLAP